MNTVGYKIFFFTSCSMFLFNFLLLYFRLSLSHVWRVSIFSCVLICSFPISFYFLFIFSLLFFFIFLQTSQKHVLDRVNGVRWRMSYVSKIIRVRLRTCPSHQVGLIVQCLVKVISLPLLSCNWDKVSGCSLWELTWFVQSKVSDSMVIILCLRWLYNGKLYINLKVDTKNPWYAT